MKFNVFAFVFFFAAIVAAVYGDREAQGRPCSDHHRCPKHYYCQFDYLNGGSSCAKDCAEGRTCPPGYGCHETYECDSCPKYCESDDIIYKNKKN